MQCMAHTIYYPAREYRPDKEQLQETVLSVSRNQFNIRQTIDGTGEQTFM